MTTDCYSTSCLKMTEIVFRLPKALSKMVMGYLMRDMGIGLPLIEDILSYHKTIRRLEYSGQHVEDILHGIAHAYMTYALYENYPIARYDGYLPSERILYDMSRTLDEWIIERMPYRRPLGPHWIQFIFDYDDRYDPDGSNIWNNVKRCIRYLTPEDRSAITTYVLRRDW